MRGGRGGSEPRPYGFRAFVCIRHYPRHHTKSRMYALRPDRERPLILIHTRVGHGLFGRCAASE